LYHYRNVDLKTHLTDITSVKSNALISNKKRYQLILPLIKILKHFHYWLCHMLCLRMPRLRKTMTFLWGTWQEFTYTLN